MFERCEPVSFGDAASSSTFGDHNGAKHTYDQYGGQSVDVTSSIELQIPFDPNAPLTPRLLGREPSPRVGGRRGGAAYHVRGENGEFARIKDDGEEEWPTGFSDEQALYLGVNGELYDALYEPLPRSLRIRGDLDSNPTKYFQQQQNTRTFEVSPFPMPELDHATFFEWEQDVLVWKDRTEKQLQGVRLANATGRHMYRPRQGMPNIERKGSSEMLLSTPPDTTVSLPNSDPTLSAGSGEPGVTSGPNTTVGDRGAVPGSAVGAAKYGSSSPMRSLNSADGGRGRHNNNYDDLPDCDAQSWDAVLIPAEPNPIHYSCYEDYATAMMRWSLLVSQTAQKIPPSPRQLPSLLQLTNHSIIHPKPLSSHDSANINYYNTYGYDDDDDSDDGDDDVSIDEDDERFGDNNTAERYRAGDGVGNDLDTDNDDDFEGTSRRVLRRKGTHDSQGNGNGSTPSSPGVGFDKRKSLKIGRLPLTLISQNSWWDSETNPNPGSPQDSPSDIYPASSSYSPSQNSPHNRSNRSFLRTPRSRVNRTKFSSQHTAPLPSRPGLSMMSHPSNLDSARMATPPATFDALPPLVPKSARGREATAENSPFSLLLTSSTLPRSGSGQSLSSSGIQVASTSPVGSSTPVSSQANNSSPSGTSPSPSSRPSTRNLLLLSSKGSQQSISPPARVAMENLFTNLISRQQSRYQQHGRFGADPARGEVSHLSTSPHNNPLGYPEINYRSLVHQSVASKRALSDTHRTLLWQAHPSRRGDLDVPYLHLSPFIAFGKPNVPSFSIALGHGHNNISSSPVIQPSSQTSPVNIPVLQAWASTLASRPRESNRTNIANSPIFNALLEALGHAPPADISTTASPSHGASNATNNSTSSSAGSAAHTLALLDVPSFVSLLATEFSLIQSAEPSDGAKKSPRKATLIHTFSTWLFPAARRSKTRDLSVSPRSNSSLAGTLKKELNQGRIDRELGDSLHHNTTTPSASPSARQTMRSHSQSPLQRIRHLQHLLKLSQEIQNPKVLFKLSFLLYLCVANRPKQASEIFAIIFESLSASAPQPEDETSALHSSTSGIDAGGAMSDDETPTLASHHTSGSNTSQNAHGTHSSTHHGSRARSSSTSSTQHSSSESGTTSITLNISSIIVNTERAPNALAYASRQAVSESFESTIYSALFLLNYGRCCPVEYHTWHKSQLPEFPDYRSAAMMPHAYTMFSARGSNPNDLSAVHSSHAPVSASSSSSVASESFGSEGGSSIPSSSASSSATGTSSSSSTMSGSGIHPVGHQRSNSNQAGGGGGHPSSFGSNPAPKHSRTPSGDHQNNSSPQVAWEIKDSATRLALCIDRAHQLQLVARFASEALAPCVVGPSSTSTSSSSTSANYGTSSGSPGAYAGTGGASSSSPTFRSASSSSYASAKQVSSLPFPFPVHENHLAFTRRLFECWRSEVAQIVHVLTKNLRDELGTESSSDSSSDDSDIVHKAAKTMPNLPSESARLIRFLLSRTGLGSRSRLASSLSHFTISWLLQFDHHVNFWQNACQIDLMKEDSLHATSSSASSTSPNAKGANSPSSGLKVTISTDLSMEGVDPDEERGGLGSSSSTFSGGFMPTHVGLNPPQSSSRMSVALSAAHIRMVLQRPGAKFIELVNHALKSKLVHVRTFASNIVDLCMNHDPVTSSGGNNTIYHAALAQTGSSLSNSSSFAYTPQMTASPSVSASLDKSSHSSIVSSSRAGQQWSNTIIGANASQSRLVSIFQPQPWVVIWMSRLGGLALLDGITHGLPMRTTIPGYGPLERYAFSANSSLSSLGMSSPRAAGLGSSASASSIHSGNNTSQNDKPTSRQRVTSVSISGVSDVSRGASGSSSNARSGTKAKPKAVQHLGRTSTSNSDSAVPSQTAITSSSNSSKTGNSANIGGGKENSSSSSSKVLGRQTSLKDVKLHALQRETAVRQQQRQRALWSNYQTVATVSAQVWHSIFWKVCGPALALFDATTPAMQFIAGKTQLSACPLWMHPHVPADHAHALLDHLAFENVPGAPAPLDKLEGIAMVLGGTCNPAQVRWSWEGAQGVPGINPPPAIPPPPPPTGSALPIAPAPPAYASATDSLALMHPFASLEPALLHDAAISALRDAKLFHRTLGRLFKSEAGSHAAILASTLVMIASSLRRQALIVPKPFNNASGTQEDATSNVSSHSANNSAPIFPPSVAQLLHKQAEVSLSVDHILRLLVFVTTPVPTHMHAASTTAASAFFRETMPLSARESTITSSSSGVPLPHSSSTLGGSTGSGMSNAAGNGNFSSNFAGGFGSSLSLLPIGGERASFFRVRTASIRLLQLLLTSTPIMNWLSDSVPLPVVPTSPSVGSNSSGLGTPQLSNTPTYSPVSSLSNPVTPFSSKPSTPQASGGGIAVSPLALSEVSQSSPSRRGKKGFFSSSKDKEKDKQDKNSPSSKENAFSRSGAGSSSVSAAGRRRKLGAGGAGSLNPTRELSSGGNSDMISPRGSSASATATSSIFNDPNIASSGGSPDSGPSAGSGGPGGIVVGRSSAAGSSTRGAGTNTSSGSSNPMSNNMGANTSTSGTVSGGASVAPLSLKGNSHLFGSSSTPSPMGSTPSSLENALTPLLSANTSPPVTPRAVTTTGATSISFQGNGSSPSNASSLSSSNFPNANLGSSSDSIASMKSGSKPINTAAGAISSSSSSSSSSAVLPKDAAAPTAESSSALWISIIEGLISVIRFGADVSSSMAASECLRSIVFARASVMDVFTKPLASQVQAAFTPLLREKKDKKGGSTMISIEELILQIRQSGVSRYHGGGGLNASAGGSSSNLLNAFGPMAAGNTGTGSVGGVGAVAGGSSSSSNATSVSNYTTPSSWLVCTMSSTHSPSNAPSLNSSSSFIATGGSSTSHTSNREGQTPTWAVPTLEASLSILLRLHASLSVGQTQTATTSLFTHLMDGLSITQPLPHIANCLYALNQLLAGPIAPMPPSTLSSSSSSSIFTTSTSSSSLSSSSSALGGGSGLGSSGSYGSGSHGLSSASGSSIPNTPANATLNSTLSAQHATYAQAARLQKYLIAQFASSQLFAKVRIIFNRLMDDEFIKSILDPVVLPPSTGFLVLPRPPFSASTTSTASSPSTGNSTSTPSKSANSAGANSTSGVPTAGSGSGADSEIPSDAIYSSHNGKGSTQNASKSQSSTFLAAMFGGKKSTKESSAALASTAASATSSSSSPASKKISSATPALPSSTPPLRTAQISPTVLASQGAPGAYLVFLQLATLCNTISHNHKLMKAAKAHPEFTECLKVFSRFQIPK